MLDLSLAGLIGAILGTVVAALVYPAVLAPIERSMRGREATRSESERQALEQRLAIVRRAVLAADILLLAGLGYWLGARVAA
jgi:hypothetical protein